MVASMATVPRVRVELRIEFCDRKTLSSVRNWGRMSSTLAM
jgi:hypothetical protein